MNRSGRAKGEINIGHDSGLIEYDQMIEGLCKKKKSVVNKGMLLFIIKKVTAQITTKFVTIHQITQLSGPGITVFGGNQSTLPEINGRMRTFIINSYQSISKRSLTFREERTISIPLCRKRSLKVIGVQLRRSALNVLSISQMNFRACGLLPDETFSVP